MRVSFYSPIAFEPWDWRNSIESGIGGSETSQVEMAWRLARRGHDVTCYAPLPEDGPREWRGTHWRMLEEATFEDPGLWVLYRCPAELDKVTPAPDRRFWLLWQDWDYPGLSESRSAKVERHVTLCQWHARYMAARYPYLAGKIWITSNGLKRDLLELVEGDTRRWVSEEGEVISAAQITRDPHKIVFASSPDRGVARVIHAVSRAREVDPRVTLHVTYGFNNLDKIASFADTAATLRQQLDQPWIVNHGRISQPDLYRLWLSAGLWVYPTTFHETSCITSMEAQACGAIPIVSPVAALAENVGWGGWIDGSADDPLTLARFTGEILRWANPEMQATIRPDMMAWARERFDWERFVDQWEAAFEGRADPRDFPVQIGFAEVAPSRPKISVLTASMRPTRLPWTQATLDAQTFRDFEWIVCGETPPPTAGPFLWMPEPTADTYCHIHAAWNRLVSGARGQLLVFLSDSTLLEPDALQRLWDHFQAHPREGVSAWLTEIDQYPGDGEPAITWLDYRMASLNQRLAPIHMELRAAALPRALLDAAGPFDEAFDNHPAMGEKDLCLRAAAHGFTFSLDGGLPARFVKHEPYDKKLVEGAAYLQSKLERASRSVQEDVAVCR